MEDQICSPEKYSMKNSYNINIFYLNQKTKQKKKKMHMINMFLSEHKLILTE